MLLFKVIFLLRQDRIERLWGKGLGQGHNHVSMALLGIMTFWSIAQSINRWSATFLKGGIDTWNISIHSFTSVNTFWFSCGEGQRTVIWPNYKILWINFLVNLQNNKKKHILTRLNTTHIIVYNIYLHLIAYIWSFWVFCVLYYVVRDKNPALSSHASQSET